MVKLENKIKNYLSINPLNLDSLPIEKYKVFPETQGIYFAVSKSKDFLYIGQTKNLNKRWKQHHQFTALSEFDDVKIHWIEVVEKRYIKKILDELEQKFIGRYKPKLNGIWNQYDRRFEVLFEDILGKDLWKIYCESKHSAQKEFDEIKEWVKYSYSSNK